MTTYIALLRGINVGGHRRLKMKDLRQMFSRIGFNNISTYIQSGNVIFDAKNRPVDELADQIKNEIADTFGYDISVIVFTADQVKTIYEKFPFGEKEGWKGYITFLSKQPSVVQQQKVEGQSGDIERFRIGQQAVYAHVDKESDEKPQFSGNFIQQQLSMPATNRNLRSVRKILAIAFKD